MDVVVPDIGDFTDVPVIEILVEVGQEVAEEDPLVVLESDKATMEVPSPSAGKIGELLVNVGDKVSEGSPLVRLDGADGAGPAPEAPAAEPVERGDNHAQLLVLGSGVGGYTAAFRAADLGLDVVLVERDDRLGGVCLNVGCIPSKALLHVGKIIAEAELAADHGVRFGAPEVDVDALRGWKDGIVGKLTGGLAQMAKGRKVRVVTGEGRFTGPNALTVGDETITFDAAIVAAGSRAAWLPGLPDDPRIVDSTGALELPDVPERLLVIGCGIIGLEMACVYDALGSKVTVVELLDQLIPGCDPDLVKPLRKRIEERYEAIHLGTKVEKLEAADDGVHATLSSGDTQVFDRVLVAVGRVPNGADIGLDAAGVRVDERGFVPVDEAMRTNVAHICAIGDVVGEPMLAHKASHQGKVAAEVLAGHDVVFHPRGIPSVAYTEPEVAWVGLTETDAEANGIAFEKAVFPWSASGRALSLDGAAGMTKLLLDPETRRVLGAGAVGPSAGDLIAEPTFAMEMGADAEDLGLTIHPHPTLSETIAFAAEAAEGTITDLPNKKLARAGK
jgi:dihydrolipoamide dehydrogenase